MATIDRGNGPLFRAPRESEHPWSRAELDQALQALDADIESILDRCRTLGEFWAEFDAAAIEIQRRAENHIWYAAAQVDRMLVRHGVMPRTGVFALPRQRQATAATIAPNIRQDGALPPRHSFQG